jgi:hypothetical protein
MNPNRLYQWEYRLRILGVTLWVLQSGGIYTRAHKLDPFPRWQHRFIKVRLLRPYTPTWTPPRTYVTGEQLTPGKLLT